MITIDKSLGIVEKRETGIIPALPNMYALLQDIDKPKKLWTERVLAFRWETVEYKRDFLNYTTHLVPITVKQFEVCEIVDADDSSNLRIILVGTEDECIQRKIEEISEQESKKELKKEEEKTKNENKKL